MVKQHHFVQWCLAVAHDFLQPAWCVICRIQIRSINLMQMIVQMIVDQPESRR